MADDQITVLTALPADTDNELLLTALAATYEVVGRHHSLDTVALAAVELVPDVLVVHDGLGREGFSDLARRLTDEVPVTRYRYRGHRIPSPWAATGPGRATTRPGTAAA